MRSELLMLIGLAVTGCGLLAQDLRHELVPQEDSPLTLIVTPHPDEKQPYYGVEVNNVSNKEVVAYGLLVSYRRKSGEAQPVHYFERRKLAAAGAAKQPFAGGKTFKPHRVLPVTDNSGRVVPAIFSLDYVLFADESKWGPDTENRGGEMAAYLRGSEESLRVLKQLKKEKGLHEVDTILEQVQIPESCGSCPRKAPQKK